jgi:hypothetical protein
MTELEELGRRAVACPQWRWLPGVRWRFDVPSHKNIWSRYIGPDAVDDQGELTCEAIPTRRGPVLIDFDDAATVGCLMAVVREVWAKTLNNGNTPVVGTSECDGMWEFGYRYGEVRVSCMWGQSEVEVLVWALENGP